MKQSRNNQITKVSLVGIGANALIATFKVIIGLLSHSVAVLLDAICHQLKEQIMAKYPGKAVLIHADTKFSE